MNRIRIGVVCPSEIAFRRFMPAIRKLDCAEYIGVAHADAQEWSGDGAPDAAVIENEAKKARAFADEYGGMVYDSYEQLLCSPDIDAVYLPLPPALHYRWAKSSLEHGRHIFVEKPSTTTEADTRALLELASAKNLAVHENYMFAFHRQIGEIRSIIDGGRIGDVRLYRIAFGFPRRPKNDFRYDKRLGGGALLDCGGYTVKLAAMLLGDTAKVAYSRLNYADGYDVDLYGSAALVNDAGTTAQVSFGMDNGYRCELEVWGSRGILRTGRILTAPDGFVPTAEITDGEGTETVSLSPDDTFGKSIERFCECVRDKAAREENYRTIMRQAHLVEEMKGTWK